MTCPDDLDLEAFIDGQAPEDHARIASHIQGCAACRKKVEDLRALNSLIRRVERQHVAPRTLVDRLRQESVVQTARRPLMTRRVMLGTAAAACVGGVAAVYGIRQARPHDLQETLFGDFRTLVAADRQMDFQSRDPGEVMAWFAPRVPFEVPRLASLGPLDIRGGRLCWLAARRCAAVDFDAPAGTLCLYICVAEDLRVNPGTTIPGDGADIFVATEAGISGAFWQRDGVAMSLIGNPSATEMISLADQIRHGTNRNFAT